MDRGMADRGTGTHSAPSPFRNFLSSMGGAGIGSMLGRMLSGGGRSAGGASGGMGGSRGFGMRNRGDYQGGGQYPPGPGPIYDDNEGKGGGGLYPSRAVKDQGGGGSWA
uniref:Uncharacterized protein n=1 Tax=Heterorhabditis bacteriophora TaxID=37862 RepID=A0A1I7XKC1_HETBA